MTAEPPFDKYPNIPCDCSGRYVLRMTIRERLFVCIECGKRLDCSEARALWERNGKLHVFKIGDGPDDFLIDPTQKDFDSDAYFHFS